MKTLSVAMSGAVACVAHIDGAHLHVAHAGDSNAVLGKWYFINNNNTWAFQKVTRCQIFRIA